MASYIQNFSKLTTNEITVLLITVVVFLIPIFIMFPPLPVRTSEALAQTHSKIGLAGHGPAKKRSGTVSSADAESDASIKRLFIYPIKSCRGIEVSRTKVLPTGFEHDRLYTFAQLKSPFPVSSVSPPDDDAADHTWEFITQRQFPQLATVETEIWIPDAKKTRGRLEGVPTESFVVLRFPWSETGVWGVFEWLVAKLGKGVHGVPEREVLLPVAFPSADEIEDRGYVYEEVRVWRDPLRALNMSGEIPEELRLYLGVSNKLALFRVDPDGLRKIYRCAPTEDEAGYQPVVGFQDAYPIHLMNEKSLRDVEAQVPKDAELKALEVQRFRPNILMTGPPAYDEESWKSIRLTRGTAAIDPDNARFHVSCRCVRCKLPNVNPKTGIRHPVQPDKHLRQNRAVDAGAPGKGCLGMQLTPLFSEAGSPTGRSNNSGESSSVEEEGSTVIVPRAKTGFGIGGEGVVGTGILRESWIEVGMGVEVEARGEHLYTKT